jgi:hypothetical protein
MSHAAYAAATVENLLKALSVTAAGSNDGLGLG